MPRRSTTGPASISARHIGGAFSGSNTFNGLVLSDYSARLLGGVQAGADYQFAPNWVVGAEGQYSWLGKNNLNAVFPNGLVYNNNQRAIASITARVGYTWGPGMVYVKGGYAYSDNQRHPDFRAAFRSPSRSIRITATATPSAPASNTCSPRTGRPRPSTCITTSAPPAS